MSNSLPPDVLQILTSLISEMGLLTGKVDHLTGALSDQQSFALKWLPAIVALFVGIIGSGATLYIGFLNRDTLREQLRVNRESAYDQIQATKDIAISQIKANLIVASRKEWIEKLRISISRIVTLANDIHSAGVLKDGKTMASFQEMWEKSAYIELMLNPNETGHNELITRMKTFLSAPTEGKNNDELSENWGELKMSFLEQAKAVLKAEWDKVKTLN